MTKNKVKISDVAGFREAQSLATKWNEPLDSFRKKHNLGIDDMLAMSAGNDPFWMTAGKVLKALWAKDVVDNIVKPHLRRIGVRNIHLRDIHYILTGMNHMVWDGSEVYQNTTGHWGDLITAFANARYLDMVEPSLIRDNKNKYDGRADYRMDEAFGGRLDYAKDSLNKEKILDLFVSWFGHLKNWQNQMPVHIEIWAEKDLALLDKVAQEYSINTVVGEGETSITQVYQIVDRIKQAGKPVRIAYIADCDVVGSNMSKAMSRKMEFIIDQLEEDDIDVKLTHLMLTPTQVNQFGLPTIPMKTSKSDAYETRKDEWMESRGLAGAVEINSFHALHPDEFRKILERFVESYFDTDVKDLVREFNRDQREVVQDLIVNNDDINDKIETAVESITDAIDEVDWDEKEEDYDESFETMLEEHGVTDYSDRDEHYQWLLDSELEYGNQLTRYLSYESGDLDNPEEGDEEW